jgi:hypothetical protein
LEVSKVPPVDIPSARTGNATSAGQAPVEQGFAPAANIAPTLDRADIRPLDVPAALQILLAEVRAALEWPLEAPDARAAIAQSPLQAAHELVDMFLQQLLDDSSNPDTPDNSAASDSAAASDGAAASDSAGASDDAAVWTEAHVQIETTMQSSLEQAINVVSLWRDIPPSVLDAARETRTLFFSALGDEPPNPLWLRPEWAGLAPRFHRFRRRRRAARRRLTDPDYPAGTLDESEEFRR